MRNVVLFIIGLLLGAAGAAIAVNALRQRDAYPRGLMQVMQHEYAGLRGELRDRRCDSTATAQALARLRDLAVRTETAVYGEATPDAPFAEYSRRMREALDAAVLTAPADCAVLTPVVESIGNTCDACHRQYR